MRCPVCGSRNVTKLKTGSYRCDDCGFLFYPDRDAIIDMRDLLSGDELSPEEVESIEEDIRTATEESLENVYGENIKNVFKQEASLDKLSDKYASEEHVYGAFVDIEGDISGTIILIVPEHSLGKIIKRYNTGVVESLRQFSEDFFYEMKKILSWNADIQRIDIAYDNMLSMMNYIDSESKKHREIMMMSYEFLTDAMENWGDMLFLPSKNSLKLLRRHA
ncbi:MAG: hypothetical protein GXO25_02405 [Euryarchaeota archaeon]|nr:hypothetical protein [Euryarchaeota archaeon]